MYPTPTSTRCFTHPSPLSVFFTNGDPIPIPFPGPSQPRSKVLGAWPFLLVQPKAGLSDVEFHKVLARAGATPAGRIGPLTVHIVRVPEQAEEAVARALARNPHIKFAEKDWAVELSEIIPNDPKYASAWHLPKIEAPFAGNTSLGDNITVAILDTGIDDMHPDLIWKSHLRLEYRQQ